MTNRYLQGHWKPVGDRVVCGAETIINCSLGNSLNQKEREFNANLIATAPDLLKQLEIVAGILSAQDDDKDDEIVKIIRKTFYVIKKAKGI